MNAPPPGQPRLVIVGATGMVGGYALCYALQGGRSPGTSSGTALTAMADVSAKTLPSGYGYEWTGTAYQEVAASGQTGALLVLAVLFAFYFSSVSTRAGSFRHGGKERHLDRRIRQGSARGGKGYPESRGARCADAVSGRRDDLVGLHPRRLPAGDCPGRRPDQPSWRGTPVFAGMIAATGIGLFVIPMLYVTFQDLRERTSARFRRAEPQTPSAT